MTGPAYRLITTDIWNIGMVMTEVRCDTGIILKAASIHEARPTNIDEREGHADEDLGIPY